MSKNIYITTPIYYINDKPHIGHTYSTLTADILARFYRFLGKNVFFSTGTDENSQKTVEAAKSRVEELKKFGRNSEEIEKRLKEELSDIDLNDENLYFFNDKLVQDYLFLQKIIEE